MKTKNTRRGFTRSCLPKGFTLIELLVVVLIIGVLAAVALPQYQKAVVKSHYATLKDLTNSIVQAQEIYYLENGNYAAKLGDLVLDMPGGKLDNSVVDRYEYEWGQCVTSAPSALSYCRDYHTDMYYQVYHQHTTADNEILAGQRGCGTFDKSSVKMQICQQETGKTDPDYTGKTYALWIYE